MVMWGDSSSEGCGFESQHSILDGHFIITYICCKIVMMFARKRAKINDKRGRGWHILLRYLSRSP